MKKPYALFAALLIVAAVACRSEAETDKKETGKEKAKLKVGDSAPDFELKNHAGETVRLKDFRDKKWVLLAFYPKDDSPGCTAEMKDFRDDYARFEKAGVQILGVSVDGQKSHVDFRDKFDLKMPLLSDPGGKVSRLYDAYNKTMGVSQRAYILIDPKGAIRYVQSETFMKYTPRGEELLKIVSAEMEAREKKK